MGKRIAHFYIKRNKINGKQRRERERGRKVKCQVILRGNMLALLSLNNSLLVSRVAANISIRTFLDCVWYLVVPCEELLPLVWKTSWLIRA